MKLRGTLFCLALGEMMSIGALVVIPVIRAAFFFILMPKFKDEVDDDVPGDKNIAFGSPSQEWTILGVSLVECLILLVANLCLIFATKDEKETPGPKKIKLLSTWWWTMVFKLVMDFCLFYMNWEGVASCLGMSMPDFHEISDFSWLVLACRIFVMGLVYCHIMTIPITLQEKKSLSIV